MRTRDALAIKATIATAVLGFAMPARAADPVVPARAIVDQHEAGPQTNPEMTAIYDADQAARADPASIDWNVLRPADAARRARTQALLEAGQLGSADDFYHAAFVFQHGDTPDDFLKAHALATVAAARGKPEAAWIAAATLDRYLQRIGQAQIYGTQFQGRPDMSWTQEPYRRDLLPDALRKATGVPSLAEQEQQRKEWERRFAGSKKP